jgi:hypothetical protein
MEPKGRRTIEYLPELRRILLLRAWVNKPRKVTQWHRALPESVKFLPATATNFHW